MAILGSGGLATVLQVSNEFAVKIIASGTAADDEAAILEVLGANPTVVGFYGQLAAQATSVGRKALLLELCQGSLHDEILKVPGKRLANPASLTAQLNVAMMINCVAQLHSRGVIHQDIKPSNFLVGQDGAIKLCDFNLSRLASDAARISGGTVLYFSPSMLNSTDEGYAADWWALGVTLYQVFHGLNTWPFSSRPLRQLDQLKPSEQMVAVKKAILKGRIRYRPLCGIPRAAKMLIEGLLDPLPEKRWGMLQVLSADYPGDPAYSAVALRFPQLRPDMERLLALRRLCKEAPLPPRVRTMSVLSCYTGCNTRTENTDDRKSPVASCRSLRALSSCLPQRHRSRKAAPPAAPEPDDVLQVDQRLPKLSSLPPPIVAASASTSVAAHTTTATADTSAGIVSARTSLVTPPAGSSLTSSPTGRRMTIGSSPNISPTGTASPPLQYRYTGNTSPPSGWRRPRSSSMTVAVVTKAASLCRALLHAPTSDAATRAGAAHAAALAPRVLLTEDGRLTQGPRVPCQVRTHQLDLAALHAAISPHMGSGLFAPRELRGTDSEYEAWRKCAGGGQVQGVEVLEEMRVVFERRRLTVVGAGSAGGGSVGSKTATQPCSSVKPTAGGFSPPSCGRRARSHTGPSAAPRTATARSQLLSRHSGTLERDPSNHSSSSGIRYPANRTSSGRESHGNGKAPCGRGLMSAFEAAANAPKYPPISIDNGAPMDPYWNYMGGSWEGQGGVANIGTAPHTAKYDAGTGCGTSELAASANDEGLLALSPDKLDDAHAVVEVNRTSAVAVCPRQSEGLVSKAARPRRPQTTCGGHQRLHGNAATGAPLGGGEEQESICRVRRQVQTFSGSDGSKTGTDGVTNTNASRMLYLPRNTAATNGAISMVSGAVAVVGSNGCPERDYLVQHNAHITSGLISIADACKLQYASKSASRRAASDRGLESAAARDINRGAERGEEERPSGGSRRAGRGVRNGNDNSRREYWPSVQEQCRRAERQQEQAAGSGDTPAGGMVVDGAKGPPRGSPGIRRHTSVAAIAQRCGAGSGAPFSRTAIPIPDEVPVLGGGVPDAAVEVLARPWLGEEPRAESGAVRHRVPVPPRSAWAACA